MSQFKIFYINVDKNGIRDTRFSKNILKMDKYRVERFEGVNVKNIKKEEYYPYFTNKAIEDAERGYKLRDEDLSLGGMGCALSHISIWEKLLDTEYDFFIIFEDDVIVSDEFVYTMLKTYTDIKKSVDPEIDLLTFTEIERSESDKIETSINGVYKREHFWGLCAYIINRTAVDKLLRNIYPIKEQVDSYISYQINRRDLHVYSSNINLRMDYNVSLYSQIQTTCVECNNTTVELIVPIVLLTIVCIYVIKTNYFVI